MDADQQTAEVKLAYARLFQDNPRPGDAMIVLADMARLSGFYGVPSITAWIAETGSPAGYEINCHELHGKRALFAALSNRASLSEDAMLTLERVARFGLPRD